MASYFGYMPRRMPCEVKPRFLVLYGSQKGQAQSIAEGIAEEAGEHGLLADLSCLDQTEKYNLERENAPVVFIVSTTGDGEPPDNALKFVKRIKKKTLPSDHYKHLCYALLALGDTNYANFCNCGKTIDCRLQELGAKQFYATGHADDGVGLELVVDPWLEGLWEAIKAALSNMASDREGHQTDLARESPDSPSDVKINLLSLTDNQKSDSAGVSVDTDFKSAFAASSSASVTQTTISDARTAPPAESPALVTQTGGTASLPTIAANTQTGNAVSHAVLEASLTCSLPQLSESSLNVPALPPPFLDVSLQEESIEEINAPLNKEGLCEVAVSRAVQLTRGDSVKTALLLELDISAHPTMTYLPGDSFDVLCPNRDTEVDEMLHRLGLQDQRHHCVHVSLRKDTKKKGAQVPAYISQNGTLEYLLTWCLEIRSVPKKAFLRALVECTGDTKQKRRLQELCSKQGAADYNLYVRDPSLSVLELLTAFPSCSPPLSLLLEHLPKLQPRPYSAAREKERQTNPEAAFGETWLFFGCRHKDRDYLFREELEGFVSSGTLSHLKVCFSRDKQEEETTSPAAPRYVQHNLLLNRQHITDILLKESGCLYVCGDAKNMAKDVNDALVEMIRAELQLDQLDAMKKLAELKEEKRYLQDIWG
ncbi:methionine synthase reductase isoform X3 [Myripristis murdjan]|uniref:methionine synthase reductase isoform X3 n=1 Tax=Myripristis murdjan TaxID=586833 RepID=UPI001175EB3D|nr:methionine synthase reductase isoform X3 [Myripristis murdjan]